MPQNVEIVLTFDDGPHNAGNNNYTDSVMDILGDNPIQDDIKAVFFVQTHAPHRGGGTHGAKMITKQKTEGHVVGIHSGAVEGHISHEVRAAAELLDDDLRNAKQRIDDLIPGNYVPKYVRAVGGDMDDPVPQIYRDANLKHIGWDVETLDNSRVQGRLRNPDEVNARIIEEVNRNLGLGRTEIVVLFHDINRYTRQRQHLERYLRTIETTIRNYGSESQGTARNPVWVTSTSRLEQILDARTRW